MPLLDGLLDGDVMLEGRLLPWSRDHQNAVRTEVGHYVIGICVLWQGPLPAELPGDGRRPKGGGVARVFAVLTVSLVLALDAQDVVDGGDLELLRLVLGHVEGDLKLGVVRLDLHDLIVSRHHEVGGGRRVGDGPGGELGSEGGHGHVHVGVASLDLLVKVGHVRVDLAPKVLGSGHHVLAHLVKLVPGGAEEGVLEKGIPNADGYHVARHLVCSI